MANVVSFLGFGLILLLGAYLFTRWSMACTLRQGRAMLAEINATLERAVPATARVLHVYQPTGIMRKPPLGRVRLLLTLEVQPPSGPPYHTTTQWFVDQTALLQLQAGASIAVRSDADTPTTIYPAVPWAPFVGPKPQQERRIKPPFITEAAA